jgi:uncharacterized protein YukE
VAGSYNLGTSTGAMQQAGQEFANALDDLNSYVAPVTSGMENLAWAGVAANQFNSLLVDWLEQFNKITAALDTMTEVMTGTAANYGGNEDWVVGEIKKLGGTVTNVPTTRQAALGMQ